MSPGQYQYLRGSLSGSLSWFLWEKHLPASLFHVPYKGHQPSPNLLLSSTQSTWHVLKVGPVTGAMALIITRVGGWADTLPSIHQV